MGSLRALLGETVDYAGLFPPAELPLEASIRNYAEYRASREAWMLSRFICPVGQLDALEPHLEPLLGEGEPFRFSVLFRGGDASEWSHAVLAADLESVDRFLQRHGNRVDVSVAEMRFPSGLLATADVKLMAAFLDDVATTIDRKGFAQLTPFYEAGFKTEAWPRALPALAEAIGNHERNAGFKLRTGGVTADAFPSTGEVAFAIAACRDRGVPMKFTAGLHHPIRHFNEGQRTTMHGFLNVFTAGIMAWSQKLEAPRVQQILEDTSSTGFVFDEERLSWKGYAVPTEEVAALRRRAVVSFGSCSFDEPREDLEALGLLPKGTPHSTRPNPDAAG